MSAHPVPANPLEGNARFEQVKLLGRGGYGFVLLALDGSTGEQVALKFIERGNQINKYVEREILNQRRLQHHHITRLHEVFLTEDYLVLVMEYAAGGELFQHISRNNGLSDAEARWFFQQIMLAVDYCHRMGVANRDIKLENVLLDGSTPRPMVKLADFGFSKDENMHSAPISRVGTPAYTAPEVISSVHGLPYSAKKADVWSCGVVLYVMTTARYPFDRPGDTTLAAGLRLHTVIQRILRSDFSFPSTPHLSDSCRDLISKMLVADPEERLSVEQVLNHPWCRQGLPAEMLDSFNSTMVSHSLANPPSVEELLELESLVQKAKVAPKQQAALRQFDELAGNSGSAGSILDWKDAMDQDPEENFEYKAVL